MRGIGEHNSSARFTQVPDVKGAHYRPSPHRHECRSLNDAVRSYEFAHTGNAVGCEDAEPSEGHAGLREASMASPNDNIRYRCSIA